MLVDASELKVQLDFSHPMFVSNDVEQVDKVDVQVLPEMFANQTTSSVLKY